MLDVHKDLSIGIPAYNEEARIQDTLLSVYQMAKEVLDRFEILVVDDGSTDQTYKLATQTAALLNDADKKAQIVRVIRKEKNEGVGSAFHLMLENTTLPYICLIPGDNAYTPDSIKQLFSEVGTAPLILSYRCKMKQQRTKLRYVLSKIATAYVKILTGAKLRDAHSLFIFPVTETKNLKIRNTGYGYHMEILSRLIRKLGRFHETSVDLTPAPDQSSKVMRPSVLCGLGFTMLKLMFLRFIRKL